MAKHNIDEKKLRAALKTAGAKFGGRTGIAKLVALAEQHKITVPEKKGGNIIGDDYRKAYGKAQNNGDEFAEALRKATVTKTKDGKKEVVDPKLLKEVAKDNGIDANRWAHQNIGQQRMNLGNVLRGMVRNGTKVKIGTKTFKGEKEGAGAAL